MKEIRREKRKVCYRCGWLLPLSSFPISDTAADGHSKVCRRCATAAQKRDWRGHNLALDKIPWPYGDDEHEMDIEAIMNHQYEE